MNDQASSRNLYVPAMGGLYDSLSGIALPLVRLAAGLIIVPHGCQKLFGWFGGGGIQGSAQFFEQMVGLAPGAGWAVFVGGVEVIGGLLLAIGLFTRIAAAAIAIQMLYIVFFINWANGFFTIPKAGIEHPLLWGIVALAFVFMGGGRFSVDRAIGKEF